VIGTATQELLARLENVAFSRWHLRPRIVMGSATFFDAFDALSLAFVLPVLVREWSITPAEIGWLISIGYLGQFAGALIFGACAERFGRVPSAAGATALMSIMSLGCALTGSFAALLAVRLVQGIGVGGEMPVAAAYINELSKAKGRGRFFLLYELIFPIGLMVTGQIGALVVPTLGWRIMFLIGGIPGLIVAALLLRLPESPRWLMTKGRLEDAEAIITDMERSGVEDGQMPVPANVSASIPSTDDRQGWRELLSRFYAGRTGIVWMLWASAYFITNGLNNWMPTLYNRVYHLSLDQSLRAATFNNVAQVLLLVACAFAIDRIGRRRWTVASFAAGAVLLGVLGSLAAASVSAVILLVTLSYGIVGSINAVLYLYTPEIYPTRMRALGTGAATCWLRLASAVAPLLVGYLVTAGGTESVFLMFAATGVIGALTALRMLETRNQPLESLAP